MRLFPPVRRQWDESLVFAVFAAFVWVGDEGLNERPALWNILNIPTSNRANLVLSSARDTESNNPPKFEQTPLPRW
jgi:hypothetical protein